MRILLFEFLTGGGCWHLGGESLGGSLLVEGTVMRDALAQDLAAIDETREIHLCHDIRLPEPRLLKQRLYEVADSFDIGFRLGEILDIADRAIFIAPESWIQLDHVIGIWEIFAGGALVSPGSKVIAICRNKHETCEYLARHGIKTPRGISFQQQPHELASELFPAVLKPRDGCGSQRVQRIDSVKDLATVDLSSESAWRLEKYHFGTHISVSVLTGPLGVIPLQPCTQRLSDDGRFTYLGGSTPIPAHLAERAKRLAQAAAGTLPNCRGYLGIDMVLGSAENGSQDVVIEINPRLTTSYLILRQACEQNLAEAMLKWAVGEPVELTWRPERFEFAVPAT